LHFKYMLFIIAEKCIFMNNLIVISLLLLVQVDRMLFYHVFI